jgi:malonyl-CoA O-methyltransferase
MTVVSSPEQSLSVEAGYDQWASTYDTVQNATRDLSAERFRLWADHFRGREVLEMGCGTGVNTEVLAGWAASTTAIDFSEGMLAEARRRVSAPSVTFRRHDLTRPLPFPDASFDTAVENLVLEHIRDVEALFHEAARVLRPGGVLLMCELHPFRQAIGKQARFSDGKGGETLIEAHLHTVGEYVNAAIDAGLRVVRVEEDGAEGEPPRLFSLVAVKG